MKIYQKKSIIFLVFILNDEIFDILKKDMIIMFTS